MVTYLYKIRPDYFHGDDDGGHDHDEHYQEPSLDLQATWEDAYNAQDKLLKDIESKSHYGIFTFIDKYYHNWVNEEKGRDAATVQRAMLDILFPRTDSEEIWQEYQTYTWLKLPEDVWQFCRLRYNWAKDQWPNLSDRITTIWTLQEFGLLPDDIDVEMVVAISERNDLRRIEIHTHGPNSEDQPTEKSDLPPTHPESSDTDEE